LASSVDIRVLMRTHVPTLFQSMHRLVYGIGI
jgi:hypothetical protein